MKQFDIPSFYRSPIISRIKAKRKEEDRSKKDFEPTELDFGTVKFYIARHFGFCYGVENAIEIVYRTIAENKGKKIYLLSEMIHNPHVNQDLRENGIQFIQDTLGKQLISWDTISNDDIVLIPAFGTTVEIENILKEKGLEIKKYDTTCPFVERVWKKSTKLGASAHTIIVHGKEKHEETRATFSHSKETGPAIIIENMDEAVELASFIRQDSSDNFFKRFEGRYSGGFDPDVDLRKLGVVNQTTILASETQAIADFLKKVVEEIHGEGAFADTRDTLCYATLDNQNAVYGMLEKEADFAIVVGGYNSSNTSHLVELCEQHLKTYYISSADKITEKSAINHYNYHKKREEETRDFLGTGKSTILITSGASCPDAMVDEVMQRIVKLKSSQISIDEVLTSAGY